MPLARLHVPDIRADVVARGLAADISATTIWRWLAADAIRPWTHRSWIFPRDPAFAAKAGRVLDLYARVFDGDPLGDHEFVISPDEKTSIQAATVAALTAPTRKSLGLSLGLPPKRQVYRALTDPAFVIEQPMRKPLATPRP